MNKHNLDSNNFDLSEIVSIELIGDTDTVDITVEDTHMFYANGIYSHNSGAKDDIVEADKIAGSYNKIMIADFAMSLSRKRSDKVNGTGRVHIIKNRYGSDGMTYSAKINTTNGHIVISDTEISEDEIGDMEQQAAASRPQHKEMPQADKVYLSKKFHELSSK